MMRTFHLQRDEDETGISGTGRVAEGVEFSDGTVVVRWIVGEHHSTVVWPDMESVAAIHGHGGKTKIIREDADPADDREHREAVGGPWTRHGHPVEGVTVYGRNRPAVARCGGPAICKQCAVDAERIRAER